MPKLSSLQIFDKIEERLRDLEAGKELEAREINVLLTTQQRQQLKPRLSISPKAAIVSSSGAAPCATGFLMDTIRNPQ